MISNGLKYQDDAGIPELTIEFSDENDFWLFRVRDNGIGIEKEYLEKIFVFFKRLHHRDPFSGNGIDIAISKKIMEANGGKIWAESEKGRGSTFYFSMKK